MDGVRNMKTIVVNGTFDILHRGHLDILNRAKTLGDFLLVCIDTDNRVKELKGSDRPINSEMDRVLLLANLKSVDMVLTFGSDQELENILKEYQPEIMVKGSDWQGKPIVGEQYCKEIVFIERTDDYSTTNTIQNIINRG
jgi:D-beta-D-heptose 7-phosphate kinase/D-beta-D-heptose 1-phosphate adenosyltransferase